MGGIHFFVEGSLHKYRSLFEEVCPAPMTIPKGQTLCTQCCTHGWLYYILDGLAKVYITTSDGNEQIIDFMMRDTLIGMDCIDDEKKSVVSIASVTEMRVLPFTPEILRRIILDNPQLGFDLVVYYGEVLRQVSFMVGSLGHADLMVRLASFFLLFIDTPDYQQNHKILLTQQEIASCINVSRAQITKMYAQLRKEKVIDTGNHYVTILDEEKLQRYSRL
ncbi:Crp/Fnr family transcriptional regulator [Angelakisella massiliensis]|uniref:Crp/Fnr family transcriptional regulator n=1 Tax=Angelakisella massiliensis TaxID=1871018 RepID=UPI0008F93805|nr:Crp/Fnr family transcriptional regulator [Angelakisella massiliensis]